MESDMLLIFLIGMLFSGALGYLILCVDPNGKSILSTIHRAVYQKLPKLLEKITGGRDSRCFRGVDCFFNYFCYTNHPIVQIFYIMVAVGGFFLYYAVGLSVHFPNSEVSGSHKWIATILACFSFYTYYKACKVGPGYLNKSNVTSYVKLFQNYYDGVLFQKEVQCLTCDITKPARSKHCKVCKSCVSKFDHHCVWIRQCVGQHNYQHFLTFLITHSILCLYGTYIGIYAFKGIINDNGLWNARFRNQFGEEFTPGYGIIFKYIFFKESLFVFIVLLCAIMGITLLIFYSYHLSMVKMDLTTNEKLKRSDFMHFCKKQITKYKKMAKEKNEKIDEQEIQKKITDFENDYKILKNCRNENQGFIKNLKTIYSY